MRWLIAIDRNGTHTMRLTYRSTYHHELVAEKSIYTYGTEYVAIAHAESEAEAQQRGLDIIYEHFPEAEQENV